MTGPITVFGGTGFLGQRVVRHLLETGIEVRVASRHANRGRKLFANAVQTIAADIHDVQSVQQALAGAQVAVNAVSLYVERGNETFQSVHVRGAKLLAREAKKAGLRKLVHVSGIGSDPRSSSKYIKARGEGELAVQGAFPDAVLIRPAVMFGPDDAFINPIADMIERLPIYPMFGRGQTRLQPAFVEDVAQAITTATQKVETQGRIFECAGPRIYTFEELLKSIAAAKQIHLRLMPIPFAAWHLIASIGEWLPSPPITRNQVELMEGDNVARAGALGFPELGIVPRSLEALLPNILRQH